MARDRVPRRTLDRLAYAALAQKTTPEQRQAARSVAPLSWLYRIWFCIELAATALSAAAAASMFGWQPWGFPRLDPYGFGSLVLGVILLRLGWQRIEGHYVRRFESAATAP